MRSGALGVLPSVDECRSSPALSQEWGIEEASSKTARGKKIEMPCGQLKYGKLIISIYRHPRLLIPRSIKLWEKEFRYCGREAYGLVPYTDRHACAVKVLDLYEKALSIFKG